MARYIDADALKNDILMKYKFNWEVPCSSEDRIIQRVVTDIRVLIERSIAADVVERSECEKWHHEYHVIKDALKQEKEYHRSTEKLVDKYQVDLEKAKQEADRLAVELEVEKALRKVGIERIFDEIERNFEEGTFYLMLDPDDYDEIKEKYVTDGSSRAPTPTGEDEGGVSDG